MSLTKEQKRELHRLSEYFKKIEKHAAGKGVDPDVFVTEYRNNSLEINMTNQTGLNPHAENRKNVFEGEGKEKLKTPVRNS